jgi:Tol biopolymer transport system component
MSSRRRRAPGLVPLEIAPLERRLVPAASLISVNVSGSDAGDERSVGADAADDFRDSTRQLSGDGRFVLFESNARNVSPSPLGDPNLNQGNIYVRDRLTGTTELVNASVDGSAYGDAGEPSMTPDGRHVVFVGAAYDGRFGFAPLVDGVVFPQNVLLGHQLYVRDLHTNTTTLVSVRPDGVGSVGNDNDVNFHPSISADGSKVVFVGGIQDDFVAGDANRLPDIFVRDLKTGTTTLVSRNAAGTSGGNNRSYAPTISADGMYVTFLSDATDLTNLPDTNNQPDLFSYSFATGKVTLLSTNTAGTAAANAGVQPRYRMDDSGLKVAFLSRSEDLMPGTGFNFFKVNFFLRDLAAGTTSLISHGPSGEALDTAGEIGLSRDGSTATFIGNAGFVPETTLPHGVSKQVYAYDTATGAISLASRSPDGVLGDSDSYHPAPSADGRFILFASSAENLAPGLPYVSNLTREKLSMYVYDRVTRDVLPVATNADGTRLVSTDGQFNMYYAISRDGSTVAFTAETTELGAIDTNNRPDVYVATTRLDAGDAPTASQSGFATSYTTSYANNGARHIAVGPILGTNRDTEANGGPAAALNGDDTLGTPDDEDGITVISDVLSSPTNGALARLTIQLTNPNPASNKLDAFVDFNQDGDWDDSGERIANSLDLGTTTGTREISFSVPAGAEGGQTVARFRLSSAGGLGPTGLATDGEIEDHPVTVVALPAVERTYRAYNPNANFHFFTTSFTEFAAAIAAGYRDESSGQDGFAVMPSQSAGSVPVYRVYNLVLGYHYYTFNQAERDFLVNLVPAPTTGPDTRTSGWRDEGTIGFIPASASPGTTTVYRLYNTDSGVHLLTHNPAVRDAVLAITERGTGRHPWQQHSSFGFAFAIAASEKLLDSGLFSVGSSGASLGAPLAMPARVKTDTALDVGPQTSDTKPNRVVLSLIAQDSTRDQQPPTIVIPNATSVAIPPDWPVETHDSSGDGPQTLASLDEIFQSLNWE